MDRSSELNETICSQLLEKAGFEPINLVRVGPDLIALGHSEEQIVNALFWLVDAKRIELMEGNRVRLLRSEPVHTAQRKSAF